MATRNENKAQHDESYSEEEKQQKTAQKEESKNVAADADDVSEHAPDVDSAIEFLHGDLTEVESTDGIDAIDEWVDFLKGHKEDNIKELSASLKELKKLLKGKKTQASEIAEVLHKLGEQTNAIGDEAGRGVKGPVHKLGKAIISSASKIEKMEAKAAKGGSETDE